MADQTDALLKAVLATTGRLAIPVPELKLIVDPTGKSEKLVNAFNLADSSRTQVEIGQQAKVDSGNLSRAVARWIDAGVMFRLEEGRETRLLHLYPLPLKMPKEKE